MSTHNLLRLFKDSKKSLFKEAYFVFEEIPKGHDAADKAAREAAKKAEAERKAAEVKDKRREGTEKEGDDKSKEETTKDPLDEALRKLDQAAFDKIVKERITPKPGEKVLTLEQVEKLIIFAKTNDPQKNLKNLFDEFKDKHITVDQLSVESIKAFLNYTKDKPGDLDILITKFAEPKILSKINDFIAAGKDYPDAIKNIYAKTKEISDFYKNLNAEALTVLADKLDDTNFKELLSKLDNSQKGGLLEAAINGSKKEPILDSLVNDKSRLSALDPAISEKIINYIVNSKPERIATTLHHELGENNKDSEEAAKKLTTKAAETLLVKLLPGFKARDQGSQDIFLNIVNNLSLGSKKELINKKELDIEIRRRLFESIPSKDTAGIARPVEGAGVETKKEEPKKDEVKKPKKEDKKKPDDKSAGDKGTDKKADKKSEPPPAAKEEEIFSKDMTFNDIIAKMGDELTFDGKSISWKFPLSVDGKAIINERSFRVSPRFLKEFNKTDHNTRDKVKLCAYRWLYEKIYKNGKITKAKGKVTSFTESQAFLKNEIAKLAKAVETPVTERPKSDAKGGKAEKKADAAPADKRPPEGPKAPGTKAGEGNKDKPAPKGRRDTEKGDRRERKEKEPTLQEKLALKVKELQAIADEVTNKDKNNPNAVGKRTIRLVGPSNDNPDGQTFNIEIDGKKVDNIIELLKKPNDKKEIEFTFKNKAGEKSEYKNYPKEEVVKKFEQMLAQVPDERPVKNYGQAIAEAEKQGYKAKIESREPKAINIDQFNTLNDGLQKFQNIIKEKGDLPTIIDQLTTLAHHLQQTLDKSSIVKINIQSNPPIVLNLADKEHPFGDEAKFKANVLEIKKAELGDATKFKTFLDKSETKEQEMAGEKDETKQMEEYLKNYAKLSGKVYFVKFGNLSEDDMVSKFRSMDGHRTVLALMKNPPFFLNGNGEVAKKAAEIVTIGRNDRVDFGDVFKYAKVTPRLKAKGLNSLMEDPDDFLKTFGTLLAKEKEGKLDKGGKEQLDLMFREVLAPCIALLEALEAMEAPKEKTKKAPEKAAETPADQKEILAAISKLCDFSDKEAGGWSKFLVWLSPGGKTGPLTMADIDGNTFTVNQGKFRDHYSRKAAFTILTNISEDKDGDGELDHYSFDKGLKKYNKDAMLAEINDRIRLGVANMLMARARQAGLDLKGQDLAKQAKEELDKYLVKDLKNISVDQIRAFQLGFVLKEARVFADQVSSAKEEFDKSTEDPIIKNHPLFKQLGSTLLEKGISPGAIRKIQEKVLFVGGAVFKNGKFDSAGLGTGIDIGNGITLGIALGANTNGDILAGFGLDIKVFDNGVLKASFNTGISIQGIAVGAGQTIKGGPLNFHLFEGAKWNWTSVMPTLGGSFGISWNMDWQAQHDMEKAESKTDFAKIWEEWKKMPQSDIEGKFEKLTKITPLWNKLLPYVAEYKLTHADVVNIVESIKEGLNRDVIEKLDSPIYLISYLGFGMIGPIPVPQVGFKLGSAEITVPNRRAISKILAELSDVATTGKLKKAVDAMDKGEKTAKFIEQTGKLVYGRDGKIMSLQKSEQVDLKDFANNIETYNSQLKRTELELHQNKNGTLTMQINNTDNKDVEIHIDPLLKDLAIIKDGKNILIEGNVDDLVISRERFAFPFEETEGSATMRDVITIRQRASLNGDRDRTWIERNEAKFLQKLEADDEFEIQRGNKGKANDKTDRQPNIKDMAGYSTKAAADIEKLEGIKDVAGKRPKLEGRLSKAQVKAIETEVARQQKEEKDLSIEEKDYEGQKVRKDFYKNLDKLFTKKDKKFLKEFRANIDDDEALTGILKKYADKTDELKDLNEKEINQGLMYLINKHFTNIYKESTKHGVDAEEELSQKQIQRINKAVLRGMERKIKFVRDKVLIPKFQTTIDKLFPKPLQTAEEMVDKIINDTYNGLRAKLKNPDFDFRQIKVEDIPGGADLFSGSRKYDKNGKISGALAETINYNTSERDERLLLGFGLLEGTTGKYDIHSKNPKEQEIARTIMEIASPIPKDDIEFIHSPLFLRFSSLNTRVLLTYTDENTIEDNKRISAIRKNPELLKKPEYKAALDRFRKVIEEIRKTQINGTTFERPIGTTGLTLRIKMDTTIGRGAYSKCTNPSFYYQEIGKVEVLQQGGKIIASFNATNEVIDTEPSKIFVSFGIGIGFKSEKVPPPQRPGKPEAGGGGGTDQHGGNPNTQGSSGNPGQAPNNGVGQGGGGNSTGSSGTNSGSAGIDSSS